VARVYSTFGPRMHMYDGRVVSNLILQALHNEPITVIYAYYSFVAPVFLAFHKLSIVSVKA